MTRFEVVLPGSLLILQVLVFNASCLGQDWRLTEERQRRIHAESRIRETQVALQWCQRRVAQLQRGAPQGEDRDVERLRRRIASL